MRRHFKQAGKPRFGYEMEMLVKTLSLVLIYSGSGCGYLLNPGKDSYALTGYGVEKVFVQVPKNSSFQVGIDTTVYHAVVRRVAASDYLKLVQNSDDADAILQSEILAATYGPTTTTPASGLNPATSGRGQDKVLTALQYGATLSCRFDLKLKNKLKNDPTTKKLWSSQFARQKTFSANNQVGVLGTTSALINESEFGRALGDLAESLADDVYESLLSLF